MQISKKFNWKPIYENVEYAELFDDCKRSPEGILHRLGRDMLSTLQLWIFVCDFGKLRLDFLPVRLVIEIFLWAGVNPNWKDRNGNNALHSAVTQAIEAIKEQKSAVYMDGIHSVIRVLVEKRAEKTGFSQEYLDFIAKVPAEPTTQGNQSDWERTRDIPTYDKKQQITKWQAVSWFQILTFSVSILVESDL